MNATEDSQRHNLESECDGLRETAMRLGCLLAGKRDELRLALWGAAAILLVALAQAGVIWSMHQPISPDDIVDRNIAKINRVLGKVVEASDKAPDCPHQEAKP